MRGLLSNLSATGQASILEQVSEEQREKLVGILKDDLDPEALTELDEEVLEDVLEHLDSKEIAAAARELETDDAATILEDLSEDERQEVLAELPAGRTRRHRARAGLSRGCGGRLMQRSLVKVADTWTVGEVIDHCREATDLPDDVYDIFVVKRGWASARLRAARPHAAHQAAGADPRNRRSRHPVAAGDGRPGRVEHVFRDKNLVSCPVVVDDDGRLLGVIMVDDVVDVIDEEAEEDLLKMGGVGSDDMHAGTVSTARMRAPWLLVNVATALVASFVISRFEDTIERS